MRCWPRAGPSSFPRNQCRWSTTLSSMSSDRSHSGVHSCDTSCHNERKKISFIQDQQASRFRVSRRLPLSQVCGVEGGCGQAARKDGEGPYIMRHVLKEYLLLNRCVGINNKQNLHFVLKIWTYVFLSSGCHGLCPETEAWLLPTPLSPGAITQHTSPATSNRTSTISSNK